MKPDEYQGLAARTLLEKPNFTPTAEEFMIIWSATGLAGEAGEALNLVKKGIFHQHGLNRDKLREELGDVLWYVAGLCTTMGISLNDVMHDNIAKLEKRYPDGYSSEASIKRVDVKKPSPFYCEAPRCTEPATVQGDAIIPGPGGNAIVGTTTRHVLTCHRHSIGLVNTKSLF